jgi:hypothetical protein
MPTFAVISTLPPSCDLWDFCSVPGFFPFPLTAAGQPRFHAGFPPASG